MEAEKTLTNEEIIRELLDLLKKNTMKEQANDVFEICRTRSRKCRKIPLSIMQKKH